MTDPKDVAALLREKYGGKESPEFLSDVARLAASEPLAYVIGNIPFMGLTIDLSSRPLIPRPETEWWTEELCTHIGDRPLRVLDLCAGSGAIGLALLKHCPSAHVSFGEISEAHTKQIEENLESNGLDASRADIRAGDLFAPFEGVRFDIVATNPPYIPNVRTLSEGVTGHEPTEALFAGPSGLDVIERILEDAGAHLHPKGEVWMECDISNIDAAGAYAIDTGASYTKIRTDLYGRPRLLVAYYL